MAYDTLTSAYARGPRADSGSERFSTLHPPAARAAHTLSSLTREELLLECFGEADFAPGDVVLEVRAGEDVLSHVDVYWRSVGVGSVDVPLAAIGQVSTDPAFRRLGFASALVAAAHRVAAGRGVAWAALFGDQRLYAKLGYRAPPEPPHEHFLVCPLGAGTSWPPGPIDTRGKW